MAKEELFHGPIGILARWYGSFPVRRGTADRQAIQTALGLLRQGSCVVILPEGTRSRSGGLIKGQPGAGLVALRSGAPILPVALVGTGKLTSPLAVLKRQRIEAIIGEPFSLPSFEGIEKAEAIDRATDLMMRRIAELMPLSMRGVYADGAAQRQPSAAAAESG
jgi:1-acyl-sn-glycerol-3-phosphate acyltransferase